MKNLIHILIVVSLFMGFQSCKKENYCKNGIQDKAEIGIDCGGNECAPCKTKIIKGGTLKIPGNYFLFLSTQEEIDSFGNFAYDTIIGNLAIVTNNVLSLSSLSTITYIDGNLHLESLGISNLDGLQNLTGINGYLAIYDVNKLTNVDELKKLETINSFIGIDYNDNLKNVNGLSNVSSTVTQLTIRFNPLLSDLNGFTKLTIKNSIAFIGNTLLSSIPSFKFDNNRADLINISDCMNNLNLDFISSLKSIENLVLINNNSFTNLDFLYDIEYIINLKVIKNIQMKDFCGISHLLNAEMLDYHYVIEKNSYNPTLFQLTGDDCSI